MPRKVLTFYACGITLTSDHTGKYHCTAYNCMDIVLYGITTRNNDTQVNYQQSPQCAQHEGFLVHNKYQTETSPNVRSFVH